MLQRLGGIRQLSLPLLLPFARNGVCQLLQLHRLRLPSLQNRLNVSGAVCSPSARNRTCMPSGDRSTRSTKQPDDPRLLGREQLVPQRRELGDGLDDLAFRHLIFVSSPPPMSAR